MKRLITLAVMLLGCAHTTPDPAPPAKDGVGADPGSGDIAGVVLPTDPETIAAGAALFGRHCSACHISGNAYAPGPDLTDDRWSHGYSPNAVYQVIWSGVPARGMPAWGGLLDEKQVAAVTAYVLSER